MALKGSRRERKIRWPNVSPPLHRRRALIVEDEALIAPVSASATTGAVPMGAIKGPLSSGALTRAVLKFRSRPGRQLCYSLLQTSARRPLISGKDGNWPGDFQSPSVKGRETRAPHI